MANTLTVGALNLSTIAHITGWEAILTPAPAAGDLYVTDFAPGGQWDPGPNQPYTYDVPLIMAGQTPDVSVPQYEQLVALLNVQVTVTRTYLTASHTHIGVPTSVNMAWDLDAPSQLRAVLSILNLSGGWT